MLTVAFYPFETPAYYAFDPCEVPAEHYIVYEKGDNIFDYLSMRLKPTDIVAVKYEGRYERMYAVIIYKLDDEVIKNMPPFKSMNEEL